MPQGHNTPSLHEILSGNFSDGLSLRQVSDQNQLILSILDNMQRGRFAWPSARDGKVFLTPAQLAILMEGIDWQQPKRLVKTLSML